MRKLLQLLGLLGVHEHQTILDAERKQAKALFAQSNNKQYAQGKIEGYGEGFKIGRMEGYQEGYAEAETVIAYKPIDQDLCFDQCYIIELTPLNISAELEEKIRQELVVLSGGNEPTEAQWEVILCRQRNTRVIAGAGSGKTTTMVFRFLVLRYYLKISLNQITIFSFTKGTVKDFREKLLVLSQNFDNPLTKDDVKQCVCTFHSKLLKFATTALSFKPGKAIFEIQESEVDVDDVDNQITSNLNSVQKKQLKLLYDELYKDDKDFRELILKLKDVILSGELLRKYDQGWMKKYLAQVQAIDLQLTQDTQPAFINQFREKFTCAEFEEVKGSVDGEPVKLHSNVYLAQYNLHIIFNPRKCDALPDETYQREYDSGQKFFLANYRKACLLEITKTREGIYTVYSQKDVDELICLLADTDELAPRLKYAVSGDFLNSEIWEYLYSFGGFIESTGIHVTDFCEKVLEKKSSPIAGKHEVYFINVLLIYWRRLQKDFSRKGMYTFNQLFQYFSDDTPEHLQRVR